MTEQDFLDQLQGISQEGLISIRDTAQAVKDAGGPYGIYTESEWDLGLTVVKGLIT